MTVTIRTNVPTALTQPKAHVGASVPPHVADFVERFYIATEDVDDHDTYMTFFEKDAVSDINTVANGAHEIRRRRESFLPRYHYMTHTYTEIFCNDPNVAYVVGQLYFHDKATDVVADATPWIARITFNSKPEDLKITDYYVWVKYPTK